MIFRMMDIKERDLISISQSGRRISLCDIVFIMSENKESAKSYSKTFPPRTEISDPRAASPSRIVSQIPLVESRHKIGSEMKFKGTCFKNFPK